MTNIFSTTIVDLFDAWASNAPTRLAAESQGETLTYGELRTASLHVSEALLVAGVKPREKVPLLTQMSLEMLPAVIGILRVGACYAPMDVALWSSSRVEAVLAELASPVALVTTECRGLKLPVLTVNFQKEWLRVPLEDACDTHDRLGEIRRDLRGDDLAWVIFTSGTTGKPKGVMIYHKAIHAVTGLDPGADIEVAAQRGIRCLLAFSIAFDGCAAVVWTTLTKGGTLAMASPSNFPEIAASCDLLHLTPSMLAILNPSGPYESVRYIFLGAEAPKLEVVRQWITPQRKVFNTYGPSETTCIISLGEIKPDEEPPFGDLLPGVRVVLVDEELEECNHGEVLITGPGLAAGYLNNPDLTAQKFIQWRGERFYRTGDLARRNADGQFVWAGRADSLVKNRGFLINLETEVEPAMRSFKSVRLAVALKWRDRLVGYVQPADIDTAALRAFMKERFDPFIIPDEIQAMDNFPVNVNGKIDRRALEAQLEMRLTQDDGFELNGHDVSAYDALRMAFSVCLHVAFRELDRESSFTRLGGNSLAAIRLSNILIEHGHLVSVVQILKLDTIALLEENLSRSGQFDQSEGLEDSEEVPVTDVQKAMVSRSLKNPVLYAIVGITKYVGDFRNTPTVQELHDACVKAASAHSIFQTRFNLTSFTLSDHQRDLDWNEISVPETEFETACAKAEDQAWQTLNNLTPAQLEIPYFDITCVSIPDRTAIAFVTRVHHALTDVFSSAIFLRDMERALAGKPVSAGPRFQDYARFMQHYKQVNLERATTFFKTMLDPLPATWNLRLASPQTQPDPYAFGLARLQSPTTVTKSALDAAARKLGITPSTIIYASWSLFLAKLTTSDRVGFSLSLSGRTISWPAAQDIVGPLTTRAPFAAAVPPQKHVRKWLVDMHKTTLDILEYDGLMHSLPEGMMQDPRTKSTCVLCFLDVPRTSPDWVYSDRQEHHFEMMWYVEQERGKESLRTEFDVQIRRVDQTWAEGVRGLPGQMLDGLVQASEETLVGDLLG